MLDLLFTMPPPQARHAMVVHIPIALGLLGVIPLILAACTGFRSVPLRTLAIACFLIASAGAFAAAQTGRVAADAVRLQQGPLAPHEEAKLAKHERRGCVAWVWPLAAAALASTTFIPRRPVRITAGVLALSAGIGVAVWFSMIGHVGGRLVYEHGLGVPQREPHMLQGIADDEPP